MNYDIFRGITLIATITPTGTTQEVVNAEHTASLSFSLPTYTEFAKGDTITIHGQSYILVKAANWEKEAERRFDYSLNFVHYSYRLLEIGFLAPDENNELTNPLVPLIANAETVIDLLILNANRIDSGWVKGVIEETETLQHSFNEDNCRGVLTKLADTCKTEFWFAGKTINFTKKGNNSGLSFRHGKGNGLTKLIRKVQDKQVVTRLYVKGSDRNLPADYPGGFLRLPGGDIYIEEQIKVDRYGLIEGFYTNDKIYPKREGTISAVTDAFTFTDVGLDFDINAQRIDGVSAKVSFITGQLAGWEFEIPLAGYNHATKTITILRNKDEKAIEVPSETGLKPAVGDKYVLLDITMPQTYITNAENDLLADAQNEYDQISDEAVNYEAPTDRLYFKSNDINISLGDYVNIAETNPAIDKNIRVVGKTTDVQDKYNVTLQLADTVAVANVVRERIASKAIQKAINANKLTDINRTRQNRKTQAEVINMVFNPDTGKFLNDKLDVDWLNAQLITVGSKAGDFILKCTAVPNFQGDANKVAFTSGQLAHNQLTDYQNGIWNFPAGSFAALDPATAYYIYLVAPWNSDGYVEIFTDAKKVDDEGDYTYFFLIGILSSVTDGYRVITNTHGATKINGGEIETGLMKNQSGQSVLDLDTRTFYGAFKFSNGQDVKAVTDQINTDLASAQDDIDAVQTLANNAQATANSALTSVNQISDDNLLTPGEKQILKREFDAVNAEYPNILAQAVANAVDADFYTATYNDLINFLSAPLANLNISSSVNGVILRNNFLYYYSERTNLLKAISDAINAKAIAAQATADNALANANEAKNFIDNVLPGDMAALQSQIDGLIETWFFDYAPTLANIPASNWATNADKDKHLGDLFYNNLDGKGYRFALSAGVYQWILLSDTDTAAALALAQQAKDTADSKRRVFGVQPFTPYDAGDLWAQGAGGDLMRCITGRLTGSYNASDWAVASKYTDDTVATQAIANASDAQASADAAQTSADTANTALADIASDNVLTPSEKQATLKEWQIIQGEKPTIIAQAQSYSLSYATYESAYNTLSGYLVSLLSDINVKASIDGATFRATFKDYYDARQDLLKLVSDAAKGLVDGLEIGGRNYYKKTDSISNLIGSSTINKTFSNNGFEALNTSSDCIVRVGLSGITKPGQYNLSFFAKASINSQFVATMTDQGQQAVQLTTNYQKISLVFDILDFYSGYNFLNIIAPSGSFYFKDIKIELGNKPTDWTPAPEDVQAGIDNAYNQASTALATANTANAAAQQAAQDAADAQAQADNAMDVAGNVQDKTDFLSTDIDGNVIATGVMIVGDALGNDNAGISGVVESNNVRFWAGVPYANRETAPFRVQDDGKVYLNKAVISGDITLGFEAGSDGGNYTSGWKISKSAMLNDMGATGESGGNNFAIIRGTTKYENNDYSEFSMGTELVSSIGGGQYSLISRIKNKRPEVGSIPGWDDTENTALELGAKGANQNYALKITEGVTKLGAIERKTTLVSSSYTMTAEDHTVIASAGVALYFPTSPKEGREIIVMKTTSSTVTLYGNGHNIKYRNETPVSSKLMEWSMTFIFTNNVWQLVSFMS